MVKKAEAKKEKKETVVNKDLDPAVFDGKVNKAVLYQVIKMYQANLRQGNSSTKTRAVVSGGGRKPWKQKGTGRARVGSIRSPLWKGGGTIFGPHPRDYSYTVPQKIRNEALRSSINSKYNTQAIDVIEGLAVEKPKTKEFKKLMLSLKIDDSKKILFVLDKIDDNLKRASRNLRGVALRRAVDLNALDVLNFERLVVTKPALSILTEKIAGAK